MSHLSVSTVVPTFNRSSLLDRALVSAVPQCEPGDEIIVVDDGSTDDTGAVAHAHGPQVRYVRTSHLGAGAARNAGVRAASCDLVAFLDSDDEWMPGKLALQRAVMEHFPEILFVFSAFGVLTALGEHHDGGLLAWRDAAVFLWGEILGAGLPSGAIPGLPAGAPRFELHVGRLYETYIRSWCVFTSTVMVRRAAAMDALHFPEDVPTYEDLECYGRLAKRGLAGYMDCETAWQGHHQGAHLTDADKGTSADAALKIISRVWGTDEEYLALHRDEYEAVMDTHRVRKVRYLLGSGRRLEARQDLADLFRPTSRSYELLTYVPGPLVAAASGLRRRAYALRDRLKS